MKGKPKGGGIAAGWGHEEINRKKSLREIRERKVRNKEIWKEKERERERERERLREQGKEKIREENWTRGKIKTERGVWKRKK